MGALHRLTGGIAAAAIALLCTAGTAVAATTWVDSGALSPETVTAGYSTVAVGGNGAVATSWRSGTASYIRVRDDHAVWGVPFVPTTNGYLRALAADGDSAFTAVWTDGSLLKSSTLVSGDDEWTAPTTLSSSAGTGRLQMTPSGSLVVSYIDLTSTRRLVVRDQTGPGTWSAETTVTESSEITDYDLAFNSAGKRVAIWSQGNGTDRYSILSSDFEDDAWSTPATIHDEVTGEPSYTVEALSVAIDPSGNTMAFFSGPDENYWTTARTSYRPNGGAWSTPQQIAANAHEVAIARKVAYAHGRFVALWNDDNDSLSAATAPSDTGAWSASETLAGGLYYWSTVSTGPSDQVGVLYGTGWDSLSTWNLGLRTLSSDGTWSATDPVIAGAQSGPNDGSLAIGADGTPVVTYVDTNHDARVIAGDVAGPELRDLSVPSTAEVGEELSLSVSPFDLWSLTASTAWMFGDGDDEDGTSVTHTYTEPGTYTVTVSATDNVGNERSAERELTVTTAPEPPVTTETTPTDTTTTDTTPTEPTTTTESPVATTTPDVVTPPPVPTTPTSPPAVVLPVTPTLEAKIVSKSIKIAATVKLAKGAKCTGIVKATTKVSGRSYKTTLKLKKSGKTCHANGTIKLKKAPAKTAKVKVTVSGKKVKKRTLTAKRSR